MLELMYVIKVGILAGVIMGMAAMILGLIRFTNLDLTSYMGCLLTGQKSGLISFAAGFGSHLLASAGFAILYALIIGLFSIPQSLHTGILAGCVHTIFSGCMMPVLDRYNPCVARGLMPKMGFFTINLGFHSAITYAAIHIIYAVILFMML